MSNPEVMKMQLADGTILEKIAEKTVNTLGEAIDLIQLVEYIGLVPSISPKWVRTGVVSDHTKFVYAVTYWKIVEVEEGTVE